MNLLLGHCEVDLLDDLDKSPLVYATEAGNQGIMSALVTGDADPNVIVRNHDTS